MHIDVVRNVPIGMPKQFREDLYVDSFVITVRRKRVMEYMLSSIRDAIDFAQALRLIGEP